MRKIWCFSFGLVYRREPLNEAHDSTFGIIENYHCWRFHGCGVIATRQITGLIFFCTGMHHEYFWGRQCTFVFPIYVRKYRKYTIDRLIVVYTVCASAVISGCHPLFFSIVYLSMIKYFLHLWLQYENSCVTASVVIWEKILQGKFRTAPHITIPDYWFTIWPPLH